MIKCALSLLIIATCIVGIFADESEKQKKLDSECAKYCYQVAKPLLLMAPVCHKKDEEIIQLNSKIANLQNKLSVYEERERKSLVEATKYNELNDKFNEVNIKLAVYEYREKGFEEGNIELKTKIANLQNDLGFYKERERKSLEEGNMCNELNEKLDKQLRILSNLEEREKKDIEEDKLNKRLNVQLGEVQEKLANCKERENKSTEIYSKTESSLKASLEEYRVRLSNLESSNLALNISNQKLKEDLEQFNYSKYSNTCLKQKPGEDTTGSVEIEGMQAFSVYCVNNLNSGPGWMLIQERTETDDMFTDLIWVIYRRGFKNYNRGFFIGLEKLYRLTNAVPHELYIDMEDWNGHKKFAHYDKFRVGHESEQYRLKDLGYYTGNAGDALRDNNNMKFSTLDRDNDNSPDIHCARKYSSGWWHNNCTKANLNGYQYNDNKYKEDGMWWLSSVPLKNVRMLIRAKVKKLECLFDQRGKSKRYDTIIVSK